MDIWGGAVDILSQMGIAGQITAAAIHHDRGVIFSDRGQRATVDLERLSARIHPQHIELMRPELITCLAAKLGKRADYIFGTEIISVAQRRDGVDVVLSNGQHLCGAFLLGADGVHSKVRRCAFDDAEWAERSLAATLGVWSGPAPRSLGPGIIRFVAPGRTLAAFRIGNSNKASIIALMRTAAAPPFGDDRDRIAHRFARAPSPVPDLLASLATARDFHSDDIVTIEMHRWHRGRVALLGDAGFAPGPAVGGGTSLAILSAYRLAAELAATGDADALARYSRLMMPIADASSHIGKAMIDALIPRSRAAVWASVALPPLLASLPPFLRRYIPVLPRAARNGLRTIAHYPIGDMT